MKGKESTYLFGQSLIILLNENFIEEKDYKAMQGKISLVLVLFSVQPKHTSSLSLLSLNLAAAFRNSRQNRQNTGEPRPQGLLAFQYGGGGSTFQIVLHMLLFSPVKLMNV